MKSEIGEFLDGLRPNQRLLAIQHRRTCGMAILLCACFVLILSFVFPAIDRVWWIAAGLLTLAAGALQIDLARRELRKTIG